MVKNEFMAENEFLPFPRDETIRKSLEKAAEHANQTIAITRLWKDVPDDLKKREATLMETGRALWQSYMQQRQRSQELEAKLASIIEIETLQKEIVECQARNQALTLRESDLAKKNEETRLKIEAAVDQNLKDKQHLENVRNQIKEKRNEPEMKRNQNRLVSSKLDEKRKSLQTLDTKLKSREKKLEEMEEKRRQLKQSCEDDKVKLERLQGDLEYKRKNEEKVQKKINERLGALDTAAKSIQSIAREL